MADSSLSRLPLAGQLGVAVLLAAVILGAFWWFYYSPALEEEQKKAQELEALERDIRALEVTASKLQEFQREVQLLEAKLETLKRILPPERETPDLMRRVQYLAAQSNLIIRRFTPATPANREFYQEVPINVDVEGTFHNLGLFFDRVGRLSRLVNVRNVKIKAQTNPSASNTIAAQCVATTYVYLDVPPPPPPGAPGAPRPGAPRPPGAPGAPGARR